MAEARSLEVVFPGDTNHMGTLFGGTLTPTPVPVLSAA
jgi:acyl-CoA hydrolase